MRAGTTDKRMYTNRSGPVVMNEPRYDGTASAHVSTLGGRYDYTFDCHDRLVRADYQATDDRPRANPENFSTEYTYNEVGAPLSLHASPCLLRKFIKKPVIPTTLK